MANQSMEGRTSSCAVIGGFQPVPIETPPPLLNYYVTVHKWVSYWQT